MNRFRMISFALLTFIAVALLASPDMCIAMTPASAPVMSPASAVVGICAASSQPSGPMLGGSDIRVVWSDPPDSSPASVNSGLGSAAPQKTHADICMDNYNNCMKGCDGAVSCSKQCKVNYDGCMKQGQ